MKLNRNHTSNNPRSATPLTDAELLTVRGGRDEPLATATTGRHTEHMTANTRGTCTDTPVPEYSFYGLFTFGGGYVC